MPPSLLSAKFSGRPTVAVGIPSTWAIHRESVTAFNFMMQTLRHSDRVLQIEQPAVVSVARNTLIEAFLALPDDVQYLLLFDDDMVVPANVIDQLVRYGLPFVSAYCTRKTWPFLPVPATFTNTTLEANGDTLHHYKPITDMEPNTGLHRCDATGAAAICIRRDVLEAMEPPYFAFIGGGEDYYFCRKVAEVKTPEMPDGVWIMIDTGTEVGHVGTFVAYPRDWFKHKAEYIAETGEVEEITGEHEVMLPAAD